ncbi:MAG TPA: phosphopantetheine-binding protein, partial [Pyrinomonadaceae bacterium]|nr:phosphopantetheine-binding protein [Pyrinomonadaceae bacterium]
KGIADDDWQKIHQVVMEAHDAKGDTSEGHLKEISALLEQRGFKVTAEQDDALRGTDRYNLYAARNRGAYTAQRTEKHTIVTPLASASEFRKTLKDQLPEYMIPSSFVLLEKLPLTRNGKVDRAALAALDARRADDAANYVAPQNHMEQTIAGIWQDALRVERVGSNDNFFELGGHSLLMAQVHSRLVQTLGREISMVEMFQHPTVSTLAKSLSNDGRGSRSLQSVQERAARQKEAMDRQQPIARKVGTAV